MNLLLKSYGTVTASTSKPVTRNVTGSVVTSKGAKSRRYRCSNLPSSPIVRETK